MSINEVFMPALSSTMTEGKIVEQASADEIYNNPQHPYTRKLLDAIPTL